MNHNSFLVSTPEPAESCDMDVAAEHAVFGDEEIKWR
jgi:hypothetical protein